MPLSTILGYCDYCERDNIELTGVLDGDPEQFLCDECAAHIGIPSVPLSKLSMCANCNSLFLDADAHVHDGKLYGPCCWDERLAITQ